MTYNGFSLETSHLEANGQIVFNISYHFFCLFFIYKKLGYHQKKGAINKMNNESITEN